MYNIQCETQKKTSVVEKVYHGHHLTMVMTSPGEMRSPGDSFATLYDYSDSVEPGRESYDGVGDDRAVLINLGPPPVAAAREVLSR